MTVLNRREFLGASLHGAAGLALTGATLPSPRSYVGLVHASHPKLVKPASPDDPLSYAHVRDMVWRAIEYGKPLAGSLEAKIRPGSWVVIKPNIVFLRSQQGYSPGDITDWRVTKAVIEYVARKSRAARITIAEGGSYRGRRDPKDDEVVEQDGRRVDAYTFDWGDEDFAGFSGSMARMLDGFRSAFPAKRFDYVDLTRDTLRDESGKFRTVQVPRFSFAPKREYFVSKTITNCDFLISVPVMKVHEQCGITGCFKNYVGTAPREAYATGQGFWNQGLHDKYSLDGRIDPFIADLAAFHPPDYSVISGIRGHQFKEHYVERPDQIIRSNLVIAGEDPVANDAVIARLLGFNPWDIDFLHMLSKRGIGSMDFRNIEVTGDEMDRFERHWGKPRNWYGRCNREWRITQNPDSDTAGWQRHLSMTDTVKLSGLQWPEPARAAQMFGASARVHADGHRKAFLWVGARGHVTALLNGEKVMEEEARTKYRVGQYQRAVELKPGANLLVFRVQPIDGDARLSVLLVNPRNDGDSVEGIRWDA